MKKCFTHKILPIIGLMFFILFVFSINCFATYNITTPSGEEYSLPNLPSSFTEDTIFFICKRGDKLFYIAKFNSVPYDGKIYRSNTGSGGLNSINYYYYSSEGVLGTYDIYHNETNYSKFSPASYRQNITSYDIWYSMTPIYSSNYNIYNEDGSLFFRTSNKPNFEITVSTAEDTMNPIIAYSNWFDYEDALKYECYISKDSINWQLMNYETLTDNGVTQFRFNYTILENGTYYFKFLDKETYEETYISREVTNILKNSSNSGYTSSGIPQPFVTYERIGESFIFKTQSFTKEQIVKYKCLYTNEFSSDMSTWSEMSISSMFNTTLNQSEYYFSFTTPKDSEDCTYYFVFYDYTLQEYGDYSSLSCIFDKMNEYEDKVSGVTEEKHNRFNELLDFFKQRFGFLTFPFEFIGNLLNRILNIEYGEPIIHIPQLKIPNTNNIIFNGYDYNFNTLLENQAINNIYNIYLIAVDFIIVIGLVILAKNILMEVLGNG